jgi:hypothetical protein
MSRFLLAFIRNCGVAIAISVFFAAGRAPSPPPKPGATAAVAAVNTRSPETPAQTQMPECDRPPGRVCRLVDAGHRVSDGTR